MPSLRQLLVLVTGVIVVWYLPNVIDLPAHRIDITELFSYVSSLREWLPWVYRARLEEQIRASTERKGAALDTLLKYKRHHQRIVENRIYIGLPVQEYCVWTEMFLDDLMKRQSKIERDPVHELDIITKDKELVNVCERILDLCGVCPPSVQHPSLLFLINQLSTFPYILFLTTSTIVGWHLLKSAIRFARRVVNAVTHRRRLILLALELVITWLIGIIFIGTVIEFIIRILIHCKFIWSDAWSKVVLGYTLPLTVIISVVVVRFVLGRLFPVNILEQLVQELDLMLHRSKVTQRTVENRLAAGASRDDLRPFEEGAASSLQIIMTFKSKALETLESEFLYKWVSVLLLHDIIPKTEEITEICERIIYLCRPAIAG